MRAIELFTALKRLITCDHPHDALVSVIVEGEHHKQCMLCGAWRHVSAAETEPWCRPAHLLGLDAVVLEFADAALSVLPDEPPACPGAPSPPASETRMAVAEAERAAETVLEMMFGCAPGGEGECETSWGQLGEAARCLALCAEQLAMFQESQKTKNAPAGMGEPDLLGAGRELRAFADGVQAWERKLAAAQRAG